MKYWITLIVISVISLGVQAHSGGTDQYGCHAGSKPYHCHNTKKSYDNNEYAKSTAAYHRNVELANTIREMYRYSNNRDIVYTMLDALDLSYNSLTHRLVKFIWAKRQGYSDEYAYEIAFIEYY